ncbi:hypothetical protein VTO73DRAFT_14489 [Trametes versicolor]
MARTHTTSKTGASAPHSTPPDAQRRGPAAPEQPSRLDQPRRPRLWPWQWLPRHGAVAHAQGCAVCDAFLNHLDVERELGVRSLIAAEEDRTTDLARGEQVKGYNLGSAAGRDDAEIIRAHDQAQEVSRLRAQVRALENKCFKLDSRLTAFKMAHGIDTGFAGEGADADSDSNFGFDPNDDEDDDDYLNLTTKERRARAAAKPRPEQVAQYLNRWFGDRGERWEHHVADVKRLKTLTRAPEDQVRPVTDEDVEMRSPTHAPQQNAPSGSIIDPPAQDRERARSPDRRSSPPHVIPMRRGRSPSVDRASATQRHRSYSPQPPYGRGYEGPSMGYAAPLHPPFFPQFGFGTGFSPAPGMAQGGRNGPTPAYADHAYGYAPHFDPTQQFVEYYGNRGGYRPPSPRRRSPSPPSRRRSPPSRGRLSRAPSPGPSRARSPGRRPLKGSEIPPPQYFKHDAPPVPRTREEIKRVIDTAQRDTVGGAHAVAKLRYWNAVAKLRYWNNGYHQKTLAITPEVERELKAYRLPQWHRDAFETTKGRADKGRLETGREDKGKARATSPLMKEPPAEADVPTWTRYAETHPALLPRHIERDESGAIAPNTVAGFVLANRFTSIGNAVPYVLRKRTRLTLFRLLAEALASSQHYAAELQRVGVTPADTMGIAAYTGPFPPTLDDVIRHASQCGIAFDNVEPALSAWATHYVRRASAPGATTTPADTPSNAGGDAPPASTDGMENTDSGGTVPADAMDIADPPHTTPVAGPSTGPADVAAHEDAPMEG